MYLRGLPSARPTSTAKKGHLPALEAERDALLPADAADSAPAAPQAEPEHQPAPLPEEEELSSGEAGVSGRSLLSPNAAPFYPARAPAFSYLAAPQLAVFPSPSKVGLTGVFGKAVTVSTGISLGLAQPPPRLVFPTFTPRLKAPCTVTSGDLAAAPPLTPPSPPPPPPPSPSAGSIAEPELTLELLAGFRSDEIEDMLTIKEQYSTKLEGGEDAMSVSSIPSQEYFEDSCVLDTSSSPARRLQLLNRSSSSPGSSLRRVTYMDCLSPPRRARPAAAPGLLPSCSPAAPVKAASSPPDTVEKSGPIPREKRVQTCRARKRLQREEEQDRVYEEREKVARQEMEKRKKQAEMAREAAEVMEQEGAVLSEGEEEQQQLLKTSWTEDRPYGGMSKSNFYSYKNKMLMLLQKHPLQEQMDLVMHLAATRSQPTSRCPIRQEKMRITVSRSALSKFLESP